MKGFIATERVGPAKVPMSLDVGRLTPRDGFQLLGLAVGALAVASLGSLLAWAAFPLYPSDLSIIRLVFVVFGASVAFLGAALAWLTAWFCWRDWTFYQQRLADYHTLVLASHEQAGGVEIERSVTGWELTATNPVHVLAVALAAHRRAQAGELAHSVRALEGPVWLGGVRLGDVSGSEAEAISRKLAALGLVEGRAARSAGRWLPDSADEIIQRVADRWSDVRGV